MLLNAGQSDAAKTKIQDKYKRVNFSNQFDKFEMNTENRDSEISQDKRAALVRSYREYGYWVHEPIKVREIPNGKFQIIDGHHRFLVAKMLGVGFYYQLVPYEDITPARAHFLQSEWKTRHFMKALSAEVPELKTIKEFAERHKMPIGTAGYLLTGRAIGYRELRDGKIPALVPMIKAEAVASLYTALKPINKSFAQTKYIGAFMWLYEQDAFDAKRMLMKARSHSSRTIKTAISVYDKPVLINFNWRVCKKAFIQHTFL